MFIVSWDITEYFHSIGLSNQKFNEIRRNLFVGPHRRCEFKCIWYIVSDKLVSSEAHRPTVWPSNVSTAVCWIFDLCRCWIRAKWDQMPSLDPSRWDHTSAVTSVTHYACDDETRVLRWQLADCYRNLCALQRGRRGGGCTQTMRTTTRAVKQSRGNCVG